MPRIQSHITETKSRLIFEQAVTEFQCEEIGLGDGDVVFRQETERDYGIDGRVDLLCCGEPTGRTAYIQLKGTEKVIEKLKRSEEVSCAGITRSNLMYCRQNNIPVMLVYVSTANGEFYYLDLQSVYEKKLEEIEGGKTVTVRIPFENSSENLKHFFEIINHYYDEKEAHRPKPEKPETEIGKTDTVENESIFTYPATPCDGEYEQVSKQGFPVASGLWKDGELEEGIEYDWLIHITDGRLIHKPDCPEDPYDATENFAYEKLEQYAWEPFTPFLLSGPYLEHDRLDRFYVVDLAVKGDMEQITNIRTLVDFLQEREPKMLFRLQQQIIALQEAAYN